MYWTSVGAEEVGYWARTASPCHEPEQSWFAAQMLLVNSGAVLPTQWTLSWESLEIWTLGLVDPKHW